MRFVQYSSGMGLRVNRRELLLSLGTSCSQEGTDAVALPPRKVSNVMSKDAGS
jgi:hypothetical protein